MKIKLLRPNSITETKYRQSDSSSYASQKVHTRGIPVPPAPLLPERVSVADYPRGRKDGDRAHNQHFNYSKPAGSS